MTRLRSALFLACVACSQKAGTPRAADPAAFVAVPLTAASSSVALQQTTHQDLVPPWSLTASDGSGLMLTRVEAKAVFEGPLAYTELHLYFHNAEDRRREGTFQITLPQHAAVSRFAMESNGQWMEAEVVERQLARRAYDDFLHRKQDPALLEKAEGNQFTAKVFPIEAKADKHIVISFSQELPGARYQLPLRGLPKTERVDISLAITGADGKRTMQTLSERNWQPDRDFVSNIAATATAVTTGTLVAGQLAVFDAVAPARTEAPTALTVLVDTSASRALGYAGYVRSVRELVGKLRDRYGAALPLEVVAFDQDSEIIFRGKAGDWGDAQDKQLVERGAAGASNLEQALVGLHAPHARVLVVTDGVLTAGAEGSELAAAVKHLAGAKVDRLDIALAGGLRDDQAAGALVHAGLPHAGAVLDLDTGADAVASALAEPVMVDVPVDIPGAAWVYPRVIPTARPGTATMIYARLTKPAQTLDVIVGGKHRTVALLGATQPLVERAVGGAEIEELEARLAAHPADAAALRTAIAQKSVATRVVSSQTSLLVLETDADYARYGIDRRSLADILTVGPDGIERQHRAAPAQIATPDPTPQKRAEHLNKPRPEPMAKVKRKVAGKDDFDGDFDGIPAEAGKQSNAGPGGPGGGDVAEQGFDREETKSVATSVARPSAPSAQPVTTPMPPPPPPAPPRMDVANPGPAVHRPPAGQRARNDESSGSESFAMETRDSAPSSSEPRDVWPPKDAPVALTGELATIEHALHTHDIAGALTRARDWHAREPGNVLALIGLGESLEATGSAVTASRVYGSIIDLFPGRADMRRFAGERIERITSKLGTPARDLVLDTYRRAVADRPDHMTGHRLLAYALVRAGKPAEAFAAILAGLDQPYPAGRFAGGERTLGDDAGMIGAAYAAAVPAKRAEIMGELAKRHLELASKPSTRFILYWETDANDVDFHIQDAHGGHAFYGNKQLRSGGELYADITTGYGPECFAIEGTPKAGPYKLSINYYSQGPMGYGMGLLEIQRFDGHGGLAFEDRPYVIMNDHAYVDLGKIQ